MNGLVEAMGFGVREFPLPAFLTGVAYSLVFPHDHHGLTGAPVRLRAVAAGPDPESALWRLAEHAARRRVTAAHSVGVGPDLRATRRSAICAARTRRRPPDAAWRLTDWHVLSPLHPAFDADLDCLLFADDEGVLLVGAVLRRRQPAGEVRALGCAPLIGEAVRRAFDGVAVKAALGQWGAPSSPQRILGERPMRDVQAQGSLPDAPVRVLWEGPHGVVAQCRIPTEDSAGPWGEPELAGPAPAELSLPCPTRRVALSRTFHENSKIRAAVRTLPPVDVGRLHPAAMSALARPYRDYGRTKVEQPLPSAKDCALLPLDEAIRRRRSAARMSERALRLEELARVLTLSAGITGWAHTRSGVDLPLRATPTAGGLCSADLYLVARNVDGLVPGVHYFHPGRRVLQLLDAETGFEEIAAHTGYPDRMAQAAAVVVYLGAFRRNQWKYWERGYRMSLLECGHLAQSVVVAASALGLVAHPIVGFEDDYFNHLVGVNGSDDAVLYLTLLGGAAR